MRLMTSSSKCRNVKELRYKNQILCFEDDQLQFRGFFVFKYNEKCNKKEPLHTIQKLNFHIINLSFTCKPSDTIALVSEDLYEASCIKSVSKSLS